MVTWIDAYCDKVYNQVPKQHNSGYSVSGRLPGVLIVEYFSNMLMTKHSLFGVFVRFE